VDIWRETPGSILIGESAPMAAEAIRLGVDPSDVVTDHGETLRDSVPAALCQTVQDIEVFILGDGVPDITRAIARALAASDPGVRFFKLRQGAGTRRTAPSPGPAGGEG
jgi:hypothetical protein